MSGALMALAGSSGSEGGYSGAPGAVAWGNVNCVGGGTNASQTLTGITGSMLVSATITGGGNLFYTLNGGTPVYYAGAFLWPAGQTLSWGVNNSGTTVSGTVTVTNNNAETTLDSFTYVVKADTGGVGGGTDL